MNGKGRITSDEEPDTGTESTRIDGWVNLSFAEYLNSKYLQLQEQISLTYECYLTGVFFSFKRMQFLQKKFRAIPHNNSLCYTA